MPQKQLDVVLINPAHRVIVYQSLGSGLSACEPPVWAAMITASLIRRGFSAEIIDANVSNLTPEQTAQSVAALDPRLVVVVVYGHNPSASTQTMPSADLVLRKLREYLPSAKTMILGPHVAALPERSLNELDVDLVCFGEGIYSVIDAIETIRNSPRPDWSKVRSVCYRDAGRTVNTESAPLVTDLNHEFPQTAWELLPMGSYRCHNWHAFGGHEREPYAAIYTSLGCPFNCEFCSIHALFRSGERALGKKSNSYRFWSPECVIDQITLLVQKYGMSNFRINDEMFLLNKKHVDSICDGIIARGYDLNIWAYARVDSVKSFDMDKLRRAGITWLALGIESASSRVLQSSNKGYQQQTVHETVELIKSAGISIIGNYIFGLPEDDEKSMQATLDLALDLNCEFANFYCATAYPGSRLFEKAVSLGWELPKNWAAYSQYSEDFIPLPTNHVSSKKVLNFRDEAFKIYYNSPGYLNMIKQKFGEETLEEIGNMLRHDLRRNLLS